MGCSFSFPFLKNYQTQAEEEEIPKQYSWDKLRVEVDVSKFTIDKLVDGETGRLPGTIDGQQFQIKNCSNSHIYIFDWSNTITIDDCTNCKIFLGPVKGSVFIRDCTDCVLVAACGQFRTRDCRNLDTFLCVNTQPIIESSTRVRVGCFQYWYPGLGDQMKQAEVTPWNNNFWNVHDFSPVEGGKNWSKLGQMFKVHDFLPLPEDSSIKGVDVSSVPARSVVPLTVGVTRESKAEESCLVLVFHSDKQEVVAMESLALVREDYPGMTIVRTSRISVRQPDAERVFGRWTKQVTFGDVLAIQLSGPGSLEAGGKISGKYGEAVGVSKGAAQAEKDIQGLFGLAEMHLGF